MVTLSEKKGHLHITRGGKRFAVPAEEGLSKGEKRKGSASLDSGGEGPASRNKKQPAPKKEKGGRLSERGRRTFSAGKKKNASLRRKQYRRASPLRGGPRGENGFSIRSEEYKPAEKGNRPSVSEALLKKIG